MSNYDYYHALKPSNMKGVSDYKIPGFRRGSWVERDLCGICVKNVNTETRFRYVLHTNGTELFVELYVGTEYGKPSIPVPGSILGEFLKDQVQGQVLVERDGHAFIKGLDGRFIGKRPSYDMCMHSNARSIINQHGNALAAMLKFPERIHSLNDATMVDKDLRTVKKFVDEMEAEYAPLKRNIQRCQDNIVAWRNKIIGVDKEMNEYHTKYKNTLFILKHHKVKLENILDEKKLKYT